MTGDKDDIDKLLDEWFGWDEPTQPNWSFKTTCTCGIAKVYGDSYPKEKHPEYCDIHGYNQKSHKDYLHEKNQKQDQNEGAD